MTLSIDRFLNQWNRYKIALVIFISMNVFSVVCALVLGINYFTVTKSAETAQMASLDKIKKADFVLASLDETLSPFRIHKKIEIKTAEDEIKILAQLEKWQELRSQLRALVGETPFDVNLLKIKLLEIKQTEIEKLTASISMLQNSTQLLIWIGSLTFVFGILAPLYLFYLMRRSLQTIRNEVQSTAFDFIKTWAETQASFGEGAFKNINFWLQILLLAGQIPGQISAHPLAQITREIAYLIRMELQKKSKTN